MKSSRSAWIKYVTLRLLFFVLPFAIIYWLGLQLQFSLPLAGGVAAVLSALISVSLSVIFLSRPRAEAAQSIVDWRNRDHTADDIAEDSAIDGEAAAAEAIADSKAAADTTANTDASVSPDAAPRD